MTLRLPTALAQKLRKRARKDRRTMTSVIELALDHYLARIDRGEQN